MKIDVSGWSCDERNRQACRNPHGCHCREITALQLAAKDRTAVPQREVIDESNGHHWIMAFNRVCCRDCGVIRRHDDRNRPCGGIVRVGLRADQQLKETP